MADQGQVWHQWLSTTLPADAPQVGDLVFVVKAWHPANDSDEDGLIGWVNKVDPQGHSAWRVLHPGVGYVWAHAVRRPTEAELAAWALAQPGGGHE